MNSSDIGALFGLSPYSTEYELFHRLRDGNVVEIDENVRMKWGTRLEARIAEGVAEDNSWVVKPFKDYIHIPELRLGASFDFEIMGGDETLLEIKNVDSLIFKESWSLDGDNLEAPPHIELQIQQQMLVSGYKKAYIAALVGGNDVKLIQREADEKIQKAIIEKSKKFWEAIANDTPPVPDYERDSEFISSLYNFASPNSVYDARGNAVLGELAEEYRSASAASDAADKRKKAIKAQILECVGSVEKVIGDTFSSISLGMIGPASYTVNKEGYRMFRINWPKGKK